MSKAKFNMPKVPNGMGDYAKYMSERLQEKDALIAELLAAFEDMMETEGCHDDCATCGYDGECRMQDYKQLIAKAKGGNN